MAYRWYSAIQTAAEKEAGTSPCYGCTERHSACAGSCEKYKDWKQRYLAYRKKLLDKEIGERMADGTRVASLTRISEAKRRRTRIG